MVKKITLLFFFTCNFAIGIHFPTSDQMLLYVKKYLPDNPVILEAGGRFGQDTNRMKRIWPHSIIHVFEPLQSSYERLLSNTRSLKNVIVYPLALTTYVGITNFYLNPGNVGASSIGTPVDWNKEEFDIEPFKVNCTTINAWAAQNKISHVDFMWLDMEGHELYVLQYAADILKSVKAIYTEISFVDVREQSGRYPDVKKLLESYGFSEVWKSCDHGRYGDALFIKLGA